MPHTAPNSVGDSPDERQTLLRIADMDISYDGEGLVALRDVNLTIGKGELIGLVGESGAGKTTLARAIMGKLKAPGRFTSGSVNFQNHDMTCLSAAEQQHLLGNRISMIVANPRSELNPILTVGQQIVNVIRHHRGLSKTDADAAALAMLKAVHISDPERRFHSYPHELSGGMAQRIVIAIALSCSPDFVISDDATSGLDVTVQNQVLSLMTEMVREKGASALFITRDISIAAHYCTRIIILYRGEIVEEADSQVFFDRPAHPYSLSLLSAFAHNEALRQRWLMPTDEDTGTSATGCIFAARCVRRKARCFQDIPALRPLGDGHLVRCHYPVED